MRVIYLCNDASVWVRVDRLDGKHGRDDSCVSGFVFIQDDDRLCTRNVCALQVGRVGWVTGAGDHFELAQTFGARFDFVFHELAGLVAEDHN